LVLFESHGAELPVSSHPRFSTASGNNALISLKSRRMMAADAPCGSSSICPPQHLMPAACSVEQKPPEWPGMSNSGMTAIAREREGERGRGRGRGRWRERVGEGGRGSGGRAS
jgi:hypothetical protein